jgi:molybdopterin molybdotransferase
MLSVTQAQDQLVKAFTPLEPEQTPIGAAIGRVLALPVSAPIDLPAFSNSSMDGFAIRADDSAGASPEHPVLLRVVLDIPAGKTAEIAIGEGEAARIMTGAPVPAGANAVIPVEDTNVDLRQVSFTTPTEVNIFRTVTSGENIRPRGLDLRMGQIVMVPGHKLRAQDVGFLAMLGIEKVWVRRRPRVAVFSTGDELLPVGHPLISGKIYDSNGVTLISLVQEFGGEAVWLGIAEDSEPVVEEYLESAAQAEVDVILSSAGVSVGAFDFVKHVVEKNGQLGFWRVNMRPGKPLAFGHYRQIPFIGLPGNPVSAFVGFHVFAGPAIRKMLGLVPMDRLKIKVELLEAIESDGRESYLRAVVSQEGGRNIARLTGHQGSGNLLSLVQANALLLVPSGVKSLPIGAVIEAWLLSN